MMASGMTSDATSSAFATAGNTTINANVSIAADKSIISEGQSQLLPEIQTPSRQRRATVSTGSPSVPQVASTAFDMDTGSPSKRKEKSKSHGNLFQLRITPISLLEAELDKREQIFIRKITYLLTTVSVCSPSPSPISQAFRSR